MKRNKIHGSCHRDLQRSLKRSGAKERPGDLLQEQRRNEGFMQCNLSDYAKNLGKEAHRNGPDEASKEAEKGSML